MFRSPLLLLLTLSAVFMGGCAQYENKRGVDVSWQDAVTRELVNGQSTRKEVLELLGPPSQVIALGDETVLYYLFERSTGNGLVLVVYNRMEVNTRYDRAIFFFDEQDVMTDFSTRIYADEDS
jgi:outer membrane protein assembly factor BamE (lipoprotein component of BamABCDE complex)